jgi:hypothetical protein
MTTTLSNNELKFEAFLETRTEKFSSTERSKYLGGHYDVKRFVRTMSVTYQNGEAKEITPVIRNVCGDIGIEATLESLDNYLTAPNCAISA